MRPGPAATERPWSRLLIPLLTFWNSLPCAQARHRHLPNRLLPHIAKGASILDVGCGDGVIASLLLRMSDAAHVQGLDVLPRDASHVPVAWFDGEHIPHADNSFDLVMLIDVLHHTDHQRQLLAEAMRVSKGPVLVKDHYWKTPLDRWILTLSDYLGNRAHGVSLPYNFLRLDQWTALFQEVTLTPVRIETFRYAPYDRSNQVVFILMPTGQRSVSMEPAGSPDGQPGQ